MNIPKHTPDQFLAMELTRKLMSIEFPAEKVPDKFPADLNCAMMSASIGGFRQQGFGRDLFKKLRDWQPPFTCADMYLAINIVRCATPNEMCCELNEDGAKFYDEIQDRVEVMQKEYDDLKNPIEEGIRREINAKEKLSLNVPIGKKVFKA